MSKRSADSARGNDGKIATVKETQAIKHHSLVEPQLPTTKSQGSTWQSSWWRKIEHPQKLSKFAELNTKIVQWRVGQQQRLQLPNPIIMQLLFANSSWLKKKFLQLRLRDTKSTKSLLELTAKLFLSKAQRWFLQYFWPLLGLSGWPSAMQNSKKKIILQWKKETFFWEPVCSRGS